MPEKMTTSCHPTDSLVTCNGADGRRRSGLLPKRRKSAYIHRHVGVQIGSLVFNFMRTGASFRAKLAS